MANLDDDDGYGYPDKDESTVLFEDDLRPIRLVFDGVASEGVVELRCSDATMNYLRVWTSPVKEQWVQLPKSWNLATETVPSQLWVEGILPEGAGAGYSGNFTLSLIHRGTVIDADLCETFVTKPFAWSPNGSVCVNWWPCRWPQQVPGYDELPGDFLSVLPSQGWNVDAMRYEDTTAYDDYIQGCTLQHFKLTGGMQIVHTHGNMGILAAAWFATEAAADAWRGDEPEMETFQSNHWGYAVLVNAAWFTAKWKPTLDLNKSMVWIMSCRSATGGGSSVAASCGGRVGFGFSALSDAATHIHNRNRLFGRMSGSLDEHRRRSDQEAFEGGTGYIGSFTMFGNGWTTLCPVPFAWFPTSYPSEATGWGCLVFDTYMDTSLPPANALIKLAGPALIDNQRWVGTNPQGLAILGVTVQARPG